MDPQQQQQLEPDMELDVLLQGFDPSQTLVDDMAVDYTFLSSLFGDSDLMQPGMGSAPVVANTTPQPDPALPMGPPPDSHELLSAVQSHPLDLPAPAGGLVMPLQQYPQQQYAQQYPQQQQQQQSPGGVWASLADPQLEAPSMMHIQQLQQLLTQQQDQRRRATAAGGALGSHPLLHTPPAAMGMMGPATDGSSFAPLWGNQQPQQQMQSLQQQQQQQPNPFQQVQQAGVAQLPVLPMQQQQGVPHMQGMPPSVGLSGNPQSPSSAPWPAAWTQPPPAAAAAAVPGPGTSWQQQQQQQQLPLHPPGGWPHMQAPLSPQQQQQQQQQGLEAGQQQGPWFTTNLSPQQAQMPWLSASNPYPSPAPLQQGQGMVPCPPTALEAAGGAPVTGGGTSRAPGPVVTTAVEAPAQQAGMQFAGGGRGRGRGRGRQQAATEDGEPISRFKRNRLRHKQNMVDMEAEVARKLQQLQALAAENSALKTKAEVLDKVIQVRDKQLSVLKVAGPAVYKSPGDSAVSMEGRAGSSSSAAAPPLLLPAQEQPPVSSSASGQSLKGSASGDIAAIERDAASMSGDALQAAANAGGNSRLIESAADVRAVSPAAAAAVVAVANAMAELQMSSSRRRGLAAPASPAMDSKQLAQTLTAAGVGSGGLTVWCAPERSGSGAGELTSSSSGGMEVKPGSGGRNPATSRSRGVGAAAAAAGAGGGVSLQQQQGLQPLLQEQPSGGTTGSREHHTALNDLEQRLAAMPQLTAMFKDMPLSDSVRHWKWMLARLSTALLRWDQGNTSMAPVIKQTIANTGFTVLNMAVLNPDVMVRFACVNMETNTPCNIHHLHGHWDAVLGVLELDPSQVQEILKALELLGPELVRQIKGRRAAVTEWQAIAEETRALRCTLLEKKQNGSRCIELGLQLEKQLDAVQASYRREYSTLVLIHGTLMDQILTPVQVARLLVHSFPYFPNGLAISLALARRERWAPAPTVGGDAAVVAAAVAALGGGGAQPLELMGSV